MRVGDRVESCVWRGFDVDSAAGPDVLRVCFADAVVAAVSGLVSVEPRSASSGAGGWAGSCVRRGRLALAARTQFRRVSGLIPRSAATDLIVVSDRDSYSATASALNSGG